MKKSRTGTQKPKKRTNHETDETAKNSLVLPSIVWTAVESGPHKRWWWYVGFSAVMIWIILFLFLISDWFLLACAATAYIAALVTYSKPPKKVDYVLNDQALTADNQELSFQDFRAFTVETAKAKDTNEIPVAIQLLPKRRIALAVVVILPDDAEEIEYIITAIGKRLQYDEAQGFLNSVRLLDRIARWLRLI